MESTHPDLQAYSPIPSPEPFNLMETPAVTQPDMAGPSQSQTKLDADFRAMLQALPMRSDIEALILRIEEAHRRDIQEVKTELHTITDRLSTRENLITSLETWVLALEQAQDMQAVDS